jgi:hypothetical protein
MTFSMDGFFSKSDIPFGTSESVEKLNLDCNITVESQHKKVENDTTDYEVGEDKSSWI